MLGSGSERWGPFDSLESVKGRNCGLTPCTKCSQTFICWLACLSVGGSTTQRKGRGNPLHTGYLVETEVSSFKETWGLGRSQGGGRGRPQTRTCSFTILPSEKHYLTPILLGSGEAVFIEQKWRVEQKSGHLMEETEVKKVTGAQSNGKGGHLWGKDGVMKGSGGQGRGCA